MTTLVPLAIYWSITMTSQHTIVILWNRKMTSCHSVDVIWTNTHTPTPPSLWMLFSTVSTNKMVDHDEFIDKLFCCPLFFKTIRQWIRLEFDNIRLDKNIHAGLSRPDHFLIIWPPTGLRYIQTHLHASINCYFIMISWYLIGDKKHYSK